MSQTDTTAVNETTAFNVVFEGHFLDGRDPIVAQSAFAKKFGEVVAGQVFGQERAVLKRNVTQEAALQIKGSLAEVGMLVSLTPAVEPAATPERKPARATSLVERAAQRAQERKQRPYGARTAKPDAQTSVERSQPSTQPSTAVDDKSPTTPDHPNAKPKFGALKWLLVSSVVLVPLVYVAINNFALS